MGGRTPPSPPGGCVNPQNALIVSGHQRSLFCAFYYVNDNFIRSYFSLYNITILDVTQHQEYLFLKFVTFQCKTNIYLTYSKQ